MKICGVYNATLYVRSICILFIIERGLGSLSIKSMNVLLHNTYQIQTTYLCKVHFNKYCLISI